MVHSRNKGMRYELDVRKFLEAWGETVDGTVVVRNSNRSGYDGDDIAFMYIPPNRLLVNLSIEAKNCKEMKLSSWIQQAHANAQPEQLPVVIHKKRGTTDVAEHYVTMKVSTLLELLAGSP